jgi:hypothetical protein
MAAAPLRWIEDTAIWEDDEEDTEQGGLRMTTIENLTLVMVDQDPEVLAATRTRDEAARVLADAEAKLRALHEIIAPPKRRIETPVTVTGMGFVRGQGFARRESTAVDVRFEQDEPDPRAVRRAQIEKPGAELALLDAQEQLTGAEAALRQVRRDAYWRRVPATDERVKRALADVAKDIARAAAKMQMLADVIVPEENAKLGLDEFGRMRYAAGEIVLGALVTSDPRVGSLVDHWRAHVRKAGWLE